MEETKVWWQSRTIWAGLVGGVFAILAAFDIVPEISQDYVLELLLGLISAGTIIFRSTANKKVTLTSQK